jgi:xylulokinase
MEGTYLMAHDLGTTGDKATLWDTKGRLIASVAKAYPLSQPKPVWAEQDPNDWWKSFIDSTKELIHTSGVSPRDIIGVGFSGQMQGCLPVNKNGEPIRSSIIWMDQRSTSQADEIKKKIGEKEYYKTTGVELTPTWSLPKIMWIKNNEPAIIEKTYKFLQSKDFIVMKLTSKFVTDFSDATLAGAFNVKKREWAYDLLEELNIPVEKLPELHPSIDVIGELDAKIAEKVGLAKDTKVILGGGDGACATVGAGAVEEGIFYNCLGTSSWICTPSKKPIIDPKMRLFNMWHLDPDLVCSLGTMQMASGSYQWLKNIVCRIEEQSSKDPGLSVYNLMDLKAKNVKIGSEKLVYLPYLMGERAPWWDPYARGVFFGLALGHNEGHLTRSVIEGVLFNLKIILDALEELGLKSEEMRLIGGGAKSDLWCELATQIYGKTTLRLENLENATSFGAALAAGVGCGIYKDFKETKKLIRVTKRYEPNKEIHDKYMKLYGFFKKLYLHLKPLFEELAKMEI